MTPTASSVKRKETSVYDLNDTQPQTAMIGGLIPDGTLLKLRMTICPGGVNGSSPLDVGLLTASKSSDVLMIGAELTVVAGPFARRKFWQNFTISGGKCYENGMARGWYVSKAIFRAVIDSAFNLDPLDMSDAAKAKRRLGGLKDLDGLTFAARIMIEPATDPRYTPRNKLANVVTPDHPHYSAVMRGTAVTPEPVNAKPHKPADTTTNPSGPTWAGQPSVSPPARPGGPAWLND
jgi:hypothetical protein